MQQTFQRKLLNFGKDGEKFFMVPREISWNHEIAGAIVLKGERADEARHEGLWVPTSEIEVTVRDSGFECSGGYAEMYRRGGSV